MTRSRFRRSKGCCHFGAVLSTALTATVALAAGDEVPAPTNVPAAVALLQREIQLELHRCGDAVVRIQAKDQHGQLAGSGFFVDPNGLLYTTYSIAGESENLVVVRGEQKIPARLLIADRRSGIALLKVDIQTPFLRIGKSRDLPLGAPVITCGYPMDHPLTPSFGLIGGFDRTYRSRYFVTTHIRASVAVQPGEGGAPLLNMQGEVVGVLISAVEGSASLALPIEAAEKVRGDFQRYGRLRPGWLGLQLEELTAAVHGSTAVVRDLYPGGAAEKAGVKNGDVFLRLADSPITCPQDMLDATFFLSAQDPVPLKVWRGEAELTLQICPADPPKPSGDRPQLAPQEPSTEETLLRLERK